MRSNILLLVLFIIQICICKSFTQSQIVIDSLVSRLSETAEDSNKLFLLDRIIGSYQDNGNANFYKSLPYALKGLDLAKHLNNTIATAIFSQRLANAYGYTGEYDKCLLNAINAINIYEETGNIEKVRDLYSQLTYMYEVQGNYEKVLEYSLKILNYSNKIGDSSRIIYSYAGIGKAYYNLSKKAIIDNDFTLANNYYFKCLDFYKQCLNYTVEAGDSNNVAWALINLGMMYDKINLFPDSSGIKQYNLIKSDYSKESIDCLNKALVFYQKKSDKNGILDSYIRLGTYYRNQGKLALFEADSIKYNLKFNESLSYYLAGLGIQTELGYTHGMAFTYKFIGDVYVKMGRTLDAEKSLLNSLKLFKETNFNEGVKECYETLSDLFLNNDNYEKGFKYFKLLSVLKDTLMGESISKKIADLNIKFETEKKENENVTLKLENENQFNSNVLLSKQYEIAELNLKFENDQLLLSDNLAKQRQDSIQFLEEQNSAQERLSLQERELSATEKKLHQKEIHNKNFLIGIVFGTAILLGTIAFLLYRVRRRKFQQNLKEVEEKALRAQLKPHFVFNALASIQKYVRENPEMAEDYLSKFSHFTQEVLVNSEKKQIPLSDELSMLSKYIELHSLRLKNPIQYKFEVDPSLDPDDIMVPPAIFQPLVENSINHNFSSKEGQGHIRIQIKEEAGILKCSIEDSCIGILKPIQAQSLRTQDRKSFGLQIVRERIDLWSKGKSLKGYLEMIPQENGMLINLGLPN